MKKILSACLLAGLFFASACNSSEKTTEVDEMEVRDEGAVGDVKDAGKDAGEAVSEAASDTKDAVTGESDPNEEEKERVKEAQEEAEEAAEAAAEGDEKR
jgi:gas vesicle protein